MYQKIVVRRLPTRNDYSCNTTTLSLSVVHSVYCMPVRYAISVFYAAWVRSRRRESSIDRTVGRQ